MPKYAFRSSDGKCVICGQPRHSNHRCPKRVIAGVEAANRRAENWYDPEHPSLPPSLRDEGSWARLHAMHP